MTSCCACCTKMHPEIPCVSEEEEAELEVEYERRRAEERRRPPLSMRAEREIEELENAIAYLERKPELYKSGSVVQPNGGATTRAGARDTAGRLQRSWCLGAAALIYGVVSLVCPRFLRRIPAAVSAGGSFPVWRMAPAADGAQQQCGCSARGDKQARVQMQNYIDRFPAFPLPARYAHRSCCAVCSRLSRKAMR